jgi:hypothetical protein
MEALVHLAEASPTDVRVNLRGGDVGMPHPAYFFDFLAFPRRRAMPA